jgi:hypothetical protein
MFTTANPPIFIVCPPLHVAPLHSLACGVRARARQSVP